MTTEPTLDEFAASTGVLEPRLLPDGRVAFLYRLMFTVAICVGRLRDAGCYDERWCYHDEWVARRALAAWSGQGDPPQGWHRHPTSGRRRPNGDPAREYVEP